MSPDSPRRLRDLVRRHASRTMFPCLALAALSLGGRRAHAQDRTILVVSVANASTGAPLPDAEVYLPELGRHLRTNWLGEARVPGLPSGVYELRVRRFGFAASDLQMMLHGDSAGVVFMLSPVAARLDTIHVRAARIEVVSHEEFNQRRRLGIGRFLDEKTLAAAGGQEFPILAASHFPGVAMISGRGGQWQLASLHGTCGVDTTYEVLSKAGTLGIPIPEQQASKVAGAGSGARQTMAESATSPSSCFSDHPCHIKLFLDDMPVAESDINIVRTSDLYGVEYYSAGNAPPRYQVSGSACGVMLLWTKTGAGG